MLDPTTEMSSASLMEPHEVSVGRNTISASSIAGIESSTSWSTKVLSTRMDWLEDLTDLLMDTATTQLF